MTVDQHIKDIAYEIEAEILKLSGLEFSQEIFSQDIPINFYGDNYLHIIRAGDFNNDKTYFNRSKETIILLHGYQACSANYFKLVKYFYKDFNVFVPDMIGMGLSSRPQVNYKESKDYINFFVDSIEAFRIAIFNMFDKETSFKNENYKKIHLIGHSLGAYIGANYALKYPRFLNKLTLLSPVGITDPKKKENKGKLSENAAFWQKIGFNLMAPFWKMKLTLREISNKFLLKNILSIGLKQRYEISDHEKELFMLLTKQSYLYPKDLDHVIYFIMAFPLPSVKYPLEDLLFYNISIQTDIIFGDKDWMDTAGSLNICSKDNLNRFNIFFLENAMHTFITENSDELGELILRRIQSTQTSTKLQMKDI